MTNRKSCDILYLTGIYAPNKKLNTFSKIDKKGQKMGIIQFDKVTAPPPARLSGRESDDEHGYDDAHLNADTLHRIFNEI